MANRLINHDDKFRRLSNQTLPTNSYVCIMRITLLLFLSLLSSFAFAATYYVSPAGNNANSGTSAATPWKTIAFALNMANDGDIIELMAGTYTGKITWTDGGVAGSPITLRNYNDDVVIIDGSTVGNGQALMAIENRSYITIDGLRFTNHNGNYQPIINLYGTCNGIIITNCEFYNTNCDDSYAILCEGKGDDIQITNNYLHDLLGFNAVGILFVGSNTTTPFTNIIVSNNILENIEPAPSEAISLNGNVDGFEIIDNTLTNINNIGIVMIGGEDWVNTNDEVNFARNGVCSNNTVSHANSIYGGGYAAGIYVDGGKNITIENNTVTGSDIGMEIGCENMGFIAENILVRNNILYRNEKSGLGFGGYDFPSTGMVQNCTFTGNTVFDNDILDIGFGQLWIQYALNCTVTNNIFYASTSPWLVNAEIVNTGMGNTLDYNAYYYPGGLENTTNFFDFDYLTGFAALQTATGQDLHSITTDPLFVNTLTPDLHLQYISPCAQAGDPSFIGADEWDMDGQMRLQGSFVDIGADEISIEPLAIVQNLTPVTCYGSCNGVLSFSGSFGCAPYNLSYKNPGGGAWITYTGPVSGKCAGTYKVRVIDGCGTTVLANAILQQDPLLTLNVASITNEIPAGAGNGKITVSSTGGFGSKQYSINGGASWQSSKKFNGLSAGTYTVWVKDAHNCMQTVTAVVGVGARIENPENISVFPNPATDAITLLTDAFSLESSYRIMHINGEVVSSGFITDTTMEIDISGLAAGMYFLYIDNHLPLTFVKQ